MKGEVYRVRAPVRLREGLEDSGEQHQQQFVSTTISAVSYFLLLFQHIYSLAIFSQCALVQSQLSDVIKVTGDGRGTLVSTNILFVKIFIYRQHHRLSPDYFARTYFSQMHYFSSMFPPLLSYNPLYSGVGVGGPASIFQYLHHIGQWQPSSCVS